MPASSENTHAQPRPRNSARSPYLSAFLGGRSPETVPVEYDRGTSEVINLHQSISSIASRASPMSGFLPDSSESCFSTLGRRSAEKTYAATEEGEQDFGCGAFPLGVLPCHVPSARTRRSRRVTRKRGLDQRAKACCACACRNFRIFLLKRGPNRRRQLKTTGKLGGSVFASASIPSTMSRRGINWLSSPG